MVCNVSSRPTSANLENAIALIAKIYKTLAETGVRKGGRENQNDTLDLTFWSDFDSVDGLVPPAPPLPIAHVTTISRSAYPLSVFTKPQASNCVFSKMADFEIDEEDVKRLREKFPLNLGNHIRKPDQQNDRMYELTPEESRFLHNTERFLRTFKICNKEVIKNVLQSISILSSSNDKVDTEWFTALTQCLPKVDDINEMRQTGNLKNSKIESPAAMIVVELVNIADLHEKLKCIQFSLDFEHGSAKLLEWSELFIRTCETVSSCDKFHLLINTITGLLQNLDSSKQSKIFGFDIQGLTRLATKRSEDGSATMLQFVIEYILSKPALLQCIDFYNNFNNFSDLTKTSIVETKVECHKWKQSLVEYKEQVEKIQGESQVSVLELKPALAFVHETSETLKLLDDSLNMVQKSFNTCIEHFGLTSSETDEVLFFDSLSKFVSVFRQTYNQVIERKYKAGRKTFLGVKKKRSIPFPGIEQKGPTRTKLETRKDSGQQNVASVSTKNGSSRETYPKGNLRLRLFEPRELQNDVPFETSDLDKSLHNMLTQTTSYKPRMKRVKATQSPMFEMSRNRR